MALLASEFLRIRSRRIVWVLATLVAAGIILATVILATKTHRASTGALDAGRAAYEQELQACGTGAAGFPRLATGESLAQFCRDNIRLADHVPDGTFGLVFLPEAFQHSAFILIVIGLVIGASSIGADWQSGSVGTLLTWESRRVRLFAVRAVVVCLGVFALAAALLALLSVLLAGVAATRGTTAWLDTSWASDALATGARVAAMAAFGSLLGLSVAMIGRSTGAALAGVFVYLAVFESLIRGLYPNSSPWLLGPNVVVFVEGIATSPGTQQILTVAHSVLVISLYAAVPWLVALTWFRARDVGN